MSHLIDSRPGFCNLPSSRHKSRSHLALFETVEKSSHPQRQTEHHNAFGYLGQSQFSSSTSCHQLVRGSPESVFWCLPESRRSPCKTDRNESSAIFAVLGVDNPSFHHATTATRPASRLCEYHDSPRVSSPVVRGALHQFKQEPDTAVDTFSAASFKNLSHSLGSHFKHASTPINCISRVSSKSPFSMQTMAEDQTSSQNRILIKGGRCVNDDAIFDADIYIEEGIIKDIGQHLIVPGGVKTIDARGYYVLPGGIDTHTHLNASFMNCKSVDDFYSGTKAALAGGTTSVLDIVIPDKGTSLIEAYKKWRSWADGHACCDYALRVAVPEFIKGKTDVEMETLVKEYGVNSFKCFMAYKDTLMLRDDELISVFDKCRELGALPIVHAENGDVIDFNVNKLKKLGIKGPEGHLQSRPEEVEAEATLRAITLANQVNCPVYIVHVMSESAAKVIADARNRGCVVFGEPITAGFGTDGTHYFNRCWRHAAAHILSPPLRPGKNTSEMLINMLASGQLHTTGSDHCTYTSEQKSLGSNDFSKIPNGVNGVEERMVILWEKGVKTGKLDPRQFVAATSANAAKIFNIYPRKGRLAKGSDADILIWGEKKHIIKAENHHSNSDFNIFEGMQVSNGPLVVISNGKVILDEKGLSVIQGNGRFIPCPTNSVYAFGSIRQREKLLPFIVDRNVKQEQVAPVQENNEPNYPIITDVSKLSLEQNNGSGFYKGSTRSGVRNLQDSSFKLSGAQIDDDKIGKTAIRVHNPPGGRSSGIW